MKNSILKKAGTFLWGRRRCAAVLAGVLLVTSVTGYMPVQPAYASSSEAPEREVYCGQKEHVHTADCYKLVCVQKEREAVKPRLECGFEVHKHDENCYDENGELICGCADYAVHTHGEECYAEDGTVICPLEEVEAHTHTDECYEMVTETTCGKEEGEGGHEHTDDCYTAELICGQEEGHTHTDACYENGEPACGKEESEAHEHTGDCYDEKGELTCGKEEGEGNNHTDECYENRKLICGKEEGHTHTDSCYERKLTCGQEEGEGGHEHTDSCYERKLTCEKEEIIVHKHDEEACYDEDGNLTCELPVVLEHKHDENCFTEGDEGHTHTEECYGELNCEIPEHTHEESCYEEQAGIALLSAEEQSRMGEIPGTVIDSGDVTDTITWSVIESKSGKRTLAVDGTGDMPDYKNPAEQPWRSYAVDGIDRIVIGDGITCIGAYSFSHMRHSGIKTEVYIGRSVKEIKNWSFAHGGYQEITIPGNVKKIGWSFPYCYDLGKVVLEEGVEEINLSGFQKLSYGTGKGELHLPQSITSVVGAGSFSGYVMDSKNASGYYTEDGVLFQDLRSGQLALVGYPTYGSAETYEIPREVTEICAGAFSNNMTLKEVIFPEGINVKVSGPGAFEKSFALERVIMSDGVTLADTRNMFYGDERLQEVQLPSSVASFNTKMFHKFEDREIYGYVLLEKLTIPQGVTIIEANSMNSCNTLGKLRYDAKDVQWIGDTFNGASLPYYELIIGRNVEHLRSRRTNNRGLYMRDLVIL